MFETDRLIVRHLCAGDLDEMYAVCGDPDIMRYVGDGKPLSLERTRDWIAQSQRNYERLGFGCAAVIDKATHRFIGYCGLIFNSDGKEVEIIYTLKKQYWGKGLASEVAAAMIEFGFTRCGLKNIIATIDPANHASLRIIKKLGMTHRENRIDEYGLPEAVYTIANPTSV